MTCHTAAIGAQLDLKLASQPDRSPTHRSRSTRVPCSEIACCDSFRLPSCHLYLRESPRSLLLVTSSDDERRGAPRRGLIFRVTDGSDKQVVVEFLPKDEISLVGVTKLTNRPVVGCLGTRVVYGRIEAD